MTYRIIVQRLGTLRLLPKRYTAKEAAEWLAIEEADLKWAIENHAQCDVDEYTVVKEEGKNG